MTEFCGLGLNLGNLSRLSKAKSRSISPENLSGDIGQGGMATEGTGAHRARGLGQGWKISPSIEIQPGAVRVLGDIHGAGAIQQVWMTNMYGRWRNLILRIYWDGQQNPSVECPIGDFLQMAGSNMRTLIRKLFVSTLDARSIVTGKCPSVNVRFLRLRIGTMFQLFSTTKSITP